MIYIHTTVGCLSCIRPCNHITDAIECPHDKESPPVPCTCEDIHPISNRKYYKLGSMSYPPIDESQYDGCYRKKKEDPRNRKPAKKGQYDWVVREVESPVLIENHWPYDPIPSGLTWSEVKWVKVLDGTISWNQYRKEQRDLDSGLDIYTTRKQIRRGGGSYNHEVVFMNEEFMLTVGEFYNFTLNKIVKITKGKDWDLFKKQEDGMNPIHDIQSEAMLKFLERLTKSGEPMLNKDGTARTTEHGTPIYYSQIRNPYYYLTRCLMSAIDTYRRERAEMRLSVVPFEILEDADYQGFTNPNELYDAYFITKNRNPKIKADIATLKQYFAELGIKAGPSQLRAVFNAILGKNMGVNGNRKTKRYIRDIAKKLEAANSSKATDLLQYLKGLPIEEDAPITRR